MSILDWIPAVSTTGLLATALWLLRSLISARLKTSVQYEFDQKIETLRTSLRNSEESFKADLRTKENEITLLRSGALSGLASRQATLDKRRIEAVDQLWQAITSLASAKSLSASMAVVKFESAAKIAANDPRLREIFSAMGKNFDHNSLRPLDAEKARPFVSPIAWALFSAYQAIVSVAAIKLELLKAGLDMPNLIDAKAVERLIALALPHQVEYVKKYGTSSYHYLLDELETRLLEELRSMLRGVDSDRASVEQAAAILKESEQIMNSLSRPRSEGESAP